MARNNNKKPYNKGGNKGGKPYDKKKDNSKPSNDKKEEEVVVTHNDFAWWWKDPDLVKSVLSLPNTGVLGTQLDMGTYTTQLPGIMTLHTVHGIPASNALQSNNAVNIAATQLYQDITRRNSRPPTTYNKQDLMIYYLAINEVSAFLSYCIRAYGAMLYWRFRNKYVPVRLFEAMGLNWETFRTHEMEFYTFLKEFVSQAASLPVPNTFDFYKRSKYVYSAYYADGSSVKSQIYMNVPALFRVYDPMDERGGTLTPLAWCTGHSGERLHSLEELKNLGWSILNPLVFDDDISVMASDILRAYGVENCYTWEICPMDFVLMPEPDNLLYLTQIHNADINYFINPTDSDALKSFEITQDQDQLTVVYEPRMKIASSTRLDYQKVWNDTKHLCDFKGNEIGEMEWFYGTMWKTQPDCDFDTDGNTWLYFFDDYESTIPTTCRTEIICGMTIFSGSEHLRYWKFMEITDDNYLDRLGGRIAMLSQFDWHPMIAGFVSNGDDVDAVVPYIELENYSDIPTTNIVNITRAAMYGIWGLGDQHLNTSVK